MKNKSKKNANKIEKNGRCKTGVLITIALILALVLGGLVGVMIFDKEETIITGIKNFIPNNVTENNKDNKETHSDEKKDNKETHSDEKKDDKEKYSDEELEKMALDYYEAKTGYRPGNAMVSLNNDGTVTIQLFDDFDDHISNRDLYIVDSKTAVGTNMFDEKIDLKVKPVKDTIE